MGTATGIISKAPRAVTAASTIDGNEQVIVDASAGALTITGPAAAKARRWGVKKADSTPNAVTIAYLNAAGTNATITLTRQDDGKTFEPLGSGYVATGSERSRVVDDVRYITQRSIISRLIAASKGARGNNAIERGPMANPPTLTKATSTIDNTLTKSYLINASQNNRANCTYTGGAFAFSTYGDNASVQSVSVIAAPGNSGNDYPAKNTTNWAFEFETDAPKVEIHTFSSTLTYMIEVNDQPIQAAGIAYPANGGHAFHLLDFTSTLGTAVKKIRVEQQQGSWIQGIAVGPTYTIWPTPKKDIRVAAVGDSVDQGTGQTLAGAAYLQVAAKLLGWGDLWQVAHGGTGWSTAGPQNTFGAALRVADVVAANPDLVLLTASQNDDAVSAATLTAAALAGFQAYRTALPNVPIVVKGVVGGSSGPSAARKANELAVKAAFDQWADPFSWWIPDTSSTEGSWETGTGTASTTNGSGNRDRYGSDSAHPNQAGHTYLGYRYARAFRQYVLGQFA